jgi:hypothetical protein
MMLAEQLKALGVSLTETGQSVCLTVAEQHGLGHLLVKSAYYIEQLERDYVEQRRARDKQVEMRVEAQQRAARLAKDARR